eukprot:364454-Chlamydomonas_euryale.AAC.6
MDFRADVWERGVQDEGLWASCSDPQRTALSIAVQGTALRNEASLDTQLLGLTSPMKEQSNLPPSITNQDGSLPPWNPALHIRFPLPPSRNTAVMTQTYNTPLHDTGHSPIPPRHPLHPLPPLSHDDERDMRPRGRAQTLAFPGDP